jgi:hypothetical protein
MANLPKFSAELERWVFISGQTDHLELASYKSWRIWLVPSSRLCCFSHSAVAWQITSFKSTPEGELTKIKRLSKWVSVVLAQSFVFSALALAQTPKLVHSNNLSALINATGANNLRIQYGGSMGTGTLGGNLLVLSITYPHGSTLSSIVDNKFSGYLLGASTDSGSGGWVTSDYYVPGSAAGITQITVNFSALVSDWHGSVREYSGIATASPLDGSCANSAATPPIVQCSSGISTSASGDLVVSSAMLVGGLGSNLCGNTSSSITPGGGFVLDSADPFCSDAEEELVQSSAGSITPSFSIGGNTNKFNIVAMAFKAVSAGTQPTGMYILHQQKVFLDESRSSQPNYFVSNGNLLVASVEVNNTNSGGGNVVTIDTCTPSNTWTKRVDSLSGGYSPQIFFIPSATTSTNMLCTVHSGQPGDTTLMVIYDVVGAASSPEDTDATTGLSGPENATITDAPDLTPSAQPGIAFAAMNIGTGPSTGTVGTGYIFDNTPYTGETDSSGLNNGDGWQHIFYTSTSRLAFGWAMNSSGAYWQAFAVSFKAASPIPSATPVITSSTSASGTVGTAFNYSITASGSPTSYAATGLPSWASINTNTGLISGTPNVAGSIATTISASNSLGTGTATLTITIQNTPPTTPVITSSTFVNGTVGTAFNYSITASGSPTSYGATGLPSWASINTITGLISGTPNVAGSTTATISASNSAGAGTATLTISIQSMTTKTTPTITWSTPAAITFGTRLSSIQLDATASVAGSFVYTPPAGTVLSVGTYTLSVTFYPTDNVDFTTAGASVTITVNPRSRRRHG